MLDTATDLSVHFLVTSLTTVTPGCKRGKSATQATCSGDAYVKLRQCHGALSSTKFVSRAVDHWPVGSWLLF